MDKERLKKIIDDPDYIPGIYNYCDGWCERCTMTSKCSNYALEKEYFPNDESKDINNQKFWDRISNMFRITLEMLEETAGERGIDLDSIDNTVIEERRLIKEEAGEKGCVLMAKRYGKDVKLWFEASEDMLKQKEEILNSHLEMELPGTHPEKEAAGIKEVIDVILWYQHQIYVKLMRAVTDKLDGFQDGIEDMPKDHNGSAKVALLGIDRSIAAWGTMLQQFPEKENSILDILVLLERIRKKTETFFPDARSFKRPGFD
jgi:hypothetical protein